MAEFSYGFNIKRDRRTADGFNCASADRTIVRLSRFTEGNNIKTGMAACVNSLYSADEEHIISPECRTDENERVIACAHKILRDMYGTVNSFVSSEGDIEFASAVAEVLKAYNKNIKFIIAARNGESEPEKEADSVVAVSEAEAQSAKRSIEKTELVSISDNDAYTLFAAAKIAKQTANKRRNVVFMLNDPCTLIPVPAADDEPTENAAVVEGAD